MWISKRVPIQAKRGTRKCPLDDYHVFGCHEFLFQVFSDGHQKKFFSFNRLETSAVTSQTRSARGMGSEAVPQLGVMIAL